MKLNKLFSKDNNVARTLFIAREKPVEDFVPKIHRAPLK